MTNIRYISLPLVALLVSLILHPTFAHPKPKPPPPQDPNQKPPQPQDPDQKPPQDTNKKPSQDPNQKPPPQDPNQKPPQNPNQNPPQDQPPPTPFHGCYKGHFTSVYAFGDSYTDTGNAQYMGGLTASFSGSLSSPYGCTTFGKGSNRLCDGRLVLDFVTDSLGLPVLPPYQSTTANFTCGVNFAVAGATTLAVDVLAKIVQTAFLWKKTPLGVWTQLEWFKKFHTDHICKGLDPPACKAKFNTALFWVGEIGINDYALALGSTIPLRSIAKSSTVYVVELVRVRIADNIPPIGCLPVDVSPCPLKQRDKSGCSTIVNGAVMIHNQIKTCCGTNSPKGELNFNLQSLCGSSGTSVCSDPSKYINWDGIHPTEAMNFHMTDQLLNQGCCQPPFDQLMKNTAVM